MLANAVDNGRNVLQTASCPGAFQQRSGLRARLHHRSRFLKPSNVGEQGLHPFVEAQILLTTQCSATRGKPAMPSERVRADAGHITVHGLRHGVVQKAHGIRPNLRMQRLCHRGTCNEMVNGRLQQRVLKEMACHPVHGMPRGNGGEVGIAELGRANGRACLR
eukprot:11228349-Lingulodinium_polyedra.AAC.3